MLDAIIQRLRQVGSVFQDRVAGAASDTAVFEQQLATVPAAFVVHLEDKAEANRGDADLAQPIVQRFAVIAVLSNLADPRGQAAATQALTIVRDALWYSLLAWAPTPCDDPIVYAGSRHLRMDAGRLYHAFFFDIPRTLTDTAARQDPTDGQLVPFQRFAPDYRLEPVDLPPPTILASDLVVVPGLPD